MSDDYCRYCSCALEIMKVKFGFTGPAMVWTCPNCALARTGLPRAYQVINVFFSTRRSTMETSSVSIFAKRSPFSEKTLSRPPDFQRTSSFG
jgi:hypothetical protein